jgi:DNA primase
MKSIASDTSMPSAVAHPASGSLNGATACDAREREACAPCETRGGRDENQDGAVVALLEAAQQHFARALCGAPAAVGYLAGRQISGRAAASFGLGYARPAWRDLGAVFEGHGADVIAGSGLLASNEASHQPYDRFRNRIMFPVRDTRGRIVGFGGRALDDVSGAKYLNSPEGPVFRKRELLFGLFEAKDAIASAGFAVVVEGFFDVVAAAQAGFEPVVATLGTACSAPQLELLLQHTKRIVFCFDGDAAGQRAAARALRTVLPLMTEDRDCAFAFLPEGEDPDSFVRSQGVGRFEAVIQAAMPLVDFMIVNASEGCDMTIAEGRARCAYAAGDLWRRMPSQPRTEQLLRVCADLLRLPPAEVKSFWEAAAYSH